MESTVASTPDSSICGRLDAPRALSKDELPDIDVTAGYRLMCRRIVGILEHPEKRGSSCLGDSSSRSIGHSTAWVARDQPRRKIIVRSVERNEALRRQLMATANASLFSLFHESRGSDALPAPPNALATDGRGLVLDPNADDVARRVREFTHGRDADVVIEVSGSNAALQEAIRTAAPNTNVVAMSWYGGTGSALALSDQLHHNRITIKSSRVGKSGWS